MSQTLSLPKISKAKKRIRNFNLCKPGIIVNSAGCLVIDENAEGFQIIGSLPYEEFVNIFQKTNEICTPILPKKCIYYNKFFSAKQIPQELYVLEYEPAIVTIKGESKHSFFFADDEIRKNSEFTLQLPFIQMYIVLSVLDNKTVISKSFLTCTNKRVSSSETPVYGLPLPNLHPDGKICWGENSFKIDEDNRLSIMNNLMNEYINSPYSCDLSINHRHPDLTSFSKWENLTKSNPKDLISIIPYNIFSSFEAFCRRVIS